MALKDWKKVGKDEWTNGSKRIYIYEIDSYDKSFPKNKYRVEIRPLKTSVMYGYGGDIGGDTKTKSQALKFAKSYMRTH